MSYVAKPKVSHGVEGIRSKPRLIQWRDLGLMNTEGEMIDLHRLLTDGTGSISIMPVTDDSMKESGLCSGSLAIVNRGSEPGAGKIIAARVNRGRVLIRRLERNKRHWVLKADDPNAESHTILPDDLIERIGVVEWALLKLNS